MTATPRPSEAIQTLLCCSGHDPIGGAGVQADIEAAAAQGVHALSLITALTAQDSFNVRSVWPTPSKLLEAQAGLLLADVHPQAIKIGLIGAEEQVAWLAQLAASCSVPVVLDPVLVAGGGTALPAATLLAALRELLLPRVTVLTPNAAEARRLTGQRSCEAAAEQLLACGVDHVLITGGDEPAADVRNYWRSAEGTERWFVWPRHPRSFHGAGCTLAATLAARLAKGEAVEAAIEQAQAYTHRALAASFAVGHGRAVPGRWRAALPEQP